MKKVAIAICAILLSGCAAVKEEGSAAVDTLTNPPAEVWAKIQEVLLWALSLFVDFFAGIIGRLGL